MKKLIVLAILASSVLTISCNNRYDDTPGNIVPPEKPVKPSDEAENHLEIQNVEVKFLGNGKFDVSYTATNDCEVDIVVSKMAIDNISGLTADGVIVGQILKVPLEGSTDGISLLVGAGKTEKGHHIFEPKAGQAIIVKAVNADDNGVISGTNNTFTIEYLEDFTGSTKVITKTTTSQK